MRRLSAILLLGLVALPAAAEPMTLGTYKVTASGTTRLMVAEGMKFDPVTGTESPAIYSVANPTGGQVGALTDQPSSGYTGGGISFATLGLGNGSYGPVPGAPLDAFATVDFAVTDTASGEVANVLFEIGATGSDDFNGQTYVDLMVRGPTESSFLLGTNRYDFRFDLYRSESFTAFFADYEVTPLGNVVDTPEPTTLALAALGLGGLFTRRLRRVI